MTCSPGCLSSEAIEWLARTTIRHAESEPHCHHLEECSICWDRFKTSVTPLPAVQVQGYLILEELGRGAASIVYAAWRCSDPPKLVALKVLWLTDEEQRIRFEREAEIHQRLDSPGIVKCFHLGRHGSFTYYEMEFIRGEPLDVYLAQHAPALSDKLAVFERVCSALAVAHEQGVAHRDIKPSNVLVDAAGQPHILDFGIGAAPTDDWSLLARRRQTKLGDILGTIKYMSPEQAWGGLIGGPIDHRSDVWTLGVILYELATDGDHPYSLQATPDRSAEEALLHRIRTELPKPPAIVDQQLAPGLTLLIDRCLVWDKQHRLPSAQHLADELQRCLTHRRVRTKRLPAVYRLERILTDLAVRRRGVLWFSSVVATLLLLSVLLYVGNVRWREDQFVQTGEGSLLARPLTPDDFVIVGITDESVQRVPEQAQKLGLNGVTDELTTWRALNGEVMKRLAPAGPGAVVWDFFFETPQPGDDVLADAVQELSRRGIPVILGVESWGDDGNPELSANIWEPLQDFAHFGGLKGRDQVRRPGEFVIAQRRGDIVVPSLALATVSALANPAWQLSLYWPRLQAGLTLSYRERGRDSVLLQRNLTLSNAYRANRDSPGVNADDGLAFQILELRRPEVWYPRVIAYERLLDAQPEQIRDWCANKVVLFGDLQAATFFNRRDRKRVRYGTEIVRDVPGSFLMADAITGLSGHSYLRPAFPLNGFALTVVAAFSLAGCALPAIPSVSRRIRLRWLRHSLSLLAILGCLVACRLLLVSEAQGVIVAGMCGASLLFCLAISAQIESTRQRFRVALWKCEQEPPSAGAGVAGQLTTANAPRSTIPASDRSESTAVPNRAAVPSLSDIG